MKGLCISSIVLAVILANVNPSTGLTTKAKPIEPELKPDLPDLPDNSERQCNLHAPKHGMSRSFTPGAHRFKKLFNKFKISVAHSISPGSEIWYKCNFGYDLQGSYSNLCLPNGTWARPAPTCTKVHPCDLNTPQYGKIHPYAAWVNTTTLTVHPRGQVRYECDAGYGLQGTNWNRCRQDGTWQRPVPTCEKGCGVRRVNNGRPSVYGLKVGQSVTWTCSFGFRLVGSANATCLDSGKLSVAVPTCQSPKKIAERRLATRSRETPQRAHEAPQETTATPPLATQSREAPRRAHEAPHKTAERRLATRSQEAERRTDEELAVLTEPSCTKCNFDADFARSAMCRSTVFVGIVNSESPTAYSFNVSRICKKTGFDGLHRFHHDTSPRKQCVRAVSDKGKQQTYTVAKSTGRLADCSAPCGLFLEKNTEYLIGAVFNDDAVVTLDGGIAMKWGPARKYFKRKVVVDPQHCSTMAQDN